jgi:hypothetical protein
MAMGRSLESETEAQEFEKQFQWLEAAEIYEHAATSQAETSSLAAHTWLHVGNCYRLASRQTSDHETFQRLRKKQEQPSILQHSCLSVTAILEVKH